MAKIFPEEISLDELNSFTDKENEFYYDEAELEDTTLMDYEETLVHLEETEIGSEFRNIVDAFYKFNKDAGWVVDRNTLLIHNAKIVRDPITKQIYVDYRGKKIRLTSKNPYKFLSLESIRKQSNTYFIRNVLGFENYNSTGIPPPVEAQVRILNQNIPQNTEVENSSPQDLIRYINQLRKNIEDLEAADNAVSEKKKILVLTLTIYLVKIFVI